MNRAAPVAVAGMGCLSALGLGVEKNLDALFGRPAGPAPPRRFPPARAGEYPVFSLPPEIVLPPAPGRTAALALAAASEAMDRAGLDREALRAWRLGVCLGTNVAGGASNQELAAATGYPSGRTYFTPAERFAASSPALALARVHGVSGPVQTVITACSAGGDAIGLAGSWIRAGICDLVLAGGADDLYPVTYNGFVSLLNYDPGPCRPFDRDRAGLNMGEGAAILILASDRLMATMGIQPVGHILGYGTASDAYHPTAPSPDARGLRRATADALADAGLSASHISLINAHGTGTRDNDRVEALFLADTFPGIPFLSTKGATGHTLGAAGAIEAVFTIAMLARGRAPATPALSVADPDLGVAPLTGPASLCGTVGLSQTLAFGGNNAVLVVSAAKGSAT